MTKATLPHKIVARYESRPRYAEWLDLLARHAERTDRGWLIEGRELYAALRRFPRDGVFEIVPEPEPEPEGRTTPRPRPTDEELAAQLARAGDRRRVCEGCQEFMGAVGKTVIRCKLRGGGTNCSACNLLNGTCKARKW